LKTSDYLIKPFAFLYIELLFQGIEKTYTQLSKLQKNFCKNMGLLILEKSYKLKLIAQVLLKTIYFSFYNFYYSIKRFNIFGGY
jgi:hypothetical protein